MMRSIDVIWFEKRNAMDERVLSFAGLRLSLLQLIMIILSSLITYASYNTTHSPLAFIALLGLMVAFVKVKSLSLFTFLSLIMQYSIRKHNYKIEYEHEARC